MNKGQGMVEYAFIVALVVIVVILGITLFGESLQALYQEILNHI
ncbi:MAG: pilus assembly protein [Clostridia bacterium]|nr:pilus assembly protein [Clostridia bacterium]